MACHGCARRWGVELRDQLEQYLVRLGLHVERGDGGIVIASRRTALRAEEFRFFVPDGGDGPNERTDVITIVPDAPHTAATGNDCFRYSDFLDYTVQADRLVVELLEDEKITSAIDVFIPPSSCRAGSIERENAVKFFFDQWLPSDANRLLVILGPAGYGKTLLSYELARRLAEAHRASRSAPRKPFPFLIPFGDFRRLPEFEGLILTALSRKGVTDFTAAAFADLVIQGRCVLFLDGFDELLEERPDEARRNLRDFVETLEGQGKVIVTARSTFFRTSTDVADFLEYFLEPDEVTVVDLQPFDASQRGRLVSQLASSQIDINRVSRVVESDAIREAMGSPLLLRETVTALLDTGNDAPLTKSPRPSELFEYLETSVYERERRRHGHRFVDPVQRSMLRSIAAEMLTTNVRGLDMELVRVASAEAVGDIEVSDGELERLADHHFLTVDHASCEVRFNHQVFREYFQALALINQPVESVLEVLSRRPLPEEVSGLVPELGGTSYIDMVLRATCDSQVGLSEQLLSNLGQLCAAYSDANAAERIQAIADLARSCQVALGFRIVDLDLSGIDFSQEILSGMEFAGCNLTGASFRRAILQHVSFSDTILDAAEFDGFEADTVTFDYDIRAFGSAQTARELEERAAHTGLEDASLSAEVDATWRSEIADLVTGRLRRFYLPGAHSTAGSRWDQSILENNLLGGLEPRARAFVRRRIVPEMVSVGIVSRWREHGDVVYRLEDAAKDDARALIENRVVQGRVSELVDRLA